MLQRRRSTNIFTIEMFVFAVFVQKIDLEQRQSQKVDVALGGYKVKR